MVGVISHVGEIPRSIYAWLQNYARPNLGVGKVYPEEIESQAKALEQKAEKGDTDAVARQLHGLSPADRMTIAKEIEDDERSKSYPSLPMLGFSATGELQMAAQCNPRGCTDAEYDTNTANPISSGLETRDGYLDRREYDPKTGNPKSWDTKDIDFTGGFTMDHSHYEYDPTTGRTISSDDNFPDGSTEHTVWHYDRTTGKLKSTDGRKSDGSASHSEYDLETGKLISVDVKNLDGSTDHTEYDPKTGDLK